MEYQHGEILVSPKTIYWIEMPESIGDHERIELLKKDILLTYQSGCISELQKLSSLNGEYSGFLYNLDGMLIVNHIDPNNAYEFFKKLAKIIKALTPRNCFVHTTIIDERITKLFKDEGIAYIEKSLYDNKIAMSTIMTLTKHIFDKEGQVHRSFVRLNLQPNKYKVAITNLNNGGQVIDGILKDISLNGMGLVLLNADDLQFIKLKEVLEIRIYLPKMILKVSKAIVTRVNNDKLEVGTNYNINDNTMIREDYASHLTSLIFSWLKGILNEYGSVKSSDK